MADKSRIQGLVALLVLTAGCRVHAGETASNLTWAYAYEDLHQACRTYYSLYPPSATCIDGHLFATRYRITYVYRGETRVVMLDYLPPPDAPLDDDGELVPRNLEVKERY